MEKTKDYDLDRERPSDLPTDQLDYPSMDGMQEAKEKEEKEARERADRELKEGYPTQWEQRNAELEKENLKNKLINENEEVEFNEEDPEFVEYNEMLELFNQGTKESYQELADRVEAELISLGASSDGREFKLLNYAKDFALDSPKWQDWIRNAIKNLHAYKKSIRIGLIKEDED